MATIGNLIVKIGADISDLKSGLSAVQSAVGKAVGDIDSLGQKVLSVGVGAAKTAAVGLAALGAGAVATGAAFLSAGSDVAEMQSKFNTVFKDQAPKSRAELDAFAAAIGRNKFELQGYAAGLQDTFVPLGFARDKAADMSVSVVKLSQDLASFNNLDPGDVVRDLQSALTGQTEVMKKYGVVINEAAIEQEALRSGLGKSAVDADKMTKANNALENAQMGYNNAVKKFGASSDQARKAQNAVENAQLNVNKAMAGGKVVLDAQAKAQAILNLVMRGTTDAQGDAERTAGGWANQMRRLWATLTQARDEIGLKLLPVFEPLLRKLNDFASAMIPKAVAAVDRFIPSLQTFINTVQDIGSKFITGFNAGGIQQALTDAFGIAQDSPIFAFFDALSALSTKVFGDISTSASGMGGTLQGAFNGFINTVLPLLTSAIKFVTENWETFKGALAGVGAALGGAGLVAILSAVGAALLALISPAGILIGLGAALGAAWVNNWWGIRDAVTAAWAVIQPALSAIFQAFQSGGFSAGIAEIGKQFANLWPVIEGTLLSWAGRFWDWLTGPKGALVQAGTKLGELLAAITKWLNDNWPTIRDKLTDWGGKFWDWLTAKDGPISKAADQLNKLTDAFTKWVNSDETQQKINNIGKSLGEMLYNALSGKAGEESQATKVVNKLLDAIAKAVLSVGSGIVVSGAELAASFVGGLLSKLTGSEVKTWTFNDLKKFADFFNQVDWKLAGEGLVTKIKEGVTGRFTDLKNEFTNTFTNIRTAITDKITEWTNIGRNLIQGVIDGIKNKASELANALRSMAKDILDTFKSALGIHSPSAAFRYLGNMAGEGWNLGIQDMVGQSQAALAELVNPPAIPAMASVGAGGGNTSTSTDNRKYSIVYNNTKPTSGTLDYNTIRAMGG